MARFLRATLVFAMLSSFGCAAFAQTTSAVSQTAPAPVQQITCRATVGPVRAVLTSGTYAPYSAVRQYSNVQTLADGTHITPKPFTEKIYRDSQGRIRTERSFCGGTEDHSGVEIVEIQDPASGYSYILDEQNRVAYRYTVRVNRDAMPPTKTNTEATAAKPVQTIAAPTAPRPSETRESLGTQTIEGLPAEGMRETRVIPEGAENNDGPITVVSEVWTSPDLKIVVLSKTSDPRRGESTMRVTNIDLSQPILSLFQPPPDYKVVDQTDRVTLTFTHTK